MRERPELGFQVRSTKAGFHQTGKMNNAFIKLVRLAAERVVVLILLSAGGAAVARAQEAKLQIEHLNKLAAKADQVVEVTLDERLLQLAAKFLSKENPTEAKVKEIVSGLKGVYVRVFEFEKPGEYSLADIETIRSQLRAPGWQKIVGVFKYAHGAHGLGVSPVS